MLIRNDYQLRPLAKFDLERVFHWRNSDRIRLNMFSDHIITMAEHCAWFDRVQLDDQDSIYRIFEFKGKPVGLVRFTDVDHKNQICTMGILFRGRGLAYWKRTNYGIPRSRICI